MASYPFAAGSVFTLTVVGSQNGQTTLNVLHYRAVDTADTTDYVSFCGGLNTEFCAAGQMRDKWLACCGEEWEMKALWVQAVYPTRLVKQVFAYTGKVGTGGAECYPQNVAAVIDKTTQYASRWGRGSLHLAGTVLGADTGGVWDVDYVSTLAELAGRMLQQIGDGPINPGVKPIIWSPKTPTRYPDLLDAQPRTTIRVMRRRTVGVGI